MPDYTASCTLLADGSVIDSNQLLEAVSGAASQTLTLMGLGTVPASGVVELRCYDSVAQPATWSNAKIVAVQVSTILP